MVQTRTITSIEQYRKLHEQALQDPQAYYAQQAKSIDWFEGYQTVNEDIASFNQPVWYKGGKLNVSYNCLDRHVAKNPDKNAILWIADQPEMSFSITYAELYYAVCDFATVLKKMGVAKGDTVSIYLPMIPEVAVAMLACTRIGAIHSVVFAGFSSVALAQRINDAKSKIVITANEGIRGNKLLPLKESVDKALEQVQIEPKVIVVERTKTEVVMQSGRDFFYHDLMQGVDEEAVAEAVDAEDPMFILYTSGSTGKPKGVLHSTAGYLTHVTCTFRDVFGLSADATHWCMADVGWITGHSYIIYGPLSFGLTTVMFEGVPTWPDASRVWQEIKNHNINSLYLAPTAIRTLQKAGDSYIEGYTNESIKVLGTVGEPINPSAWEWFNQMAGKSKVPIVDTWWQTETGGVMISPIAAVTSTKPGSATLPYPGIQVAILDTDGNELAGECEGELVIKRSWPSQLRTVYGDHDRFKQVYLEPRCGYYYTGDGAKRDADGYYWITGRLDDVVNVSGHRIGTAEVESALVTHPEVTEAAVVGVADEVKGQVIYAFVITNTQVQGFDKGLVENLQQVVRTNIGSFAIPKHIVLTDNLPKTRSGKIMRRILRKISEGEREDFGDISTLAEPEVVQQMLAAFTEQTADSGSKAGV